MSCLHLVNTCQLNLYTAIGYIPPNIGGYMPVEGFLPLGPTVRGPTVRFLRADSWAPDSWAPGPNCRGPTIRGPIRLEPYEVGFG